MSGFHAYCLIFGAAFGLRSVFSERLRLDPRGMPEAIALPAPTLHTPRPGRFLAACWRLVGYCVAGPGILDPAIEMARVNAKKRDALCFGGELIARAEEAPGIFCDFLRLRDRLSLRT